MKEFNLEKVEQLFNEDGFYDGLKSEEISENNFEAFMALEKEFSLHSDKMGIGKVYGKEKTEILKREFYKERFDEVFKQKNKFFYFLKTEEGEYIGFIYGYIVDLPSLFAAGKVGYLDKIIISKEFRGKKYASFMQNIFLQWLKEKDVKVVQLHVSANNKNTEDIYEKWGWKTDELRMYKEL